MPSRYLVATMAIVLSGPAISTAQTAAHAPMAIHNPVLRSGADPWVIRHARTYYYMNTLGDRLAIRATRNLATLADAAEIVVWRPPPTGPNAQSIWAPELHRLNGKWYIYYTAAAAGYDDDAHRGIFVLENASADPLTGHWIDRGRLATQRPGIDGTVFVNKGRRYFAYSPYVGNESDIAIVAMRNPWTLTGPETIIARPDQDWERQGGRQILEGPAFLRGPRGDLFLSYSGSACWSDGYAIGLLHASPGADPLSAASWSKSPHPVVATSPKTNVYAPGHNGFFSGPGSADTWIIYHANAGPDMKCTAKRAPYIQRMTFDHAGWPLWPSPAGRPPAP